MGGALDLLATAFDILAYAIDRIASGDQNTCGKKRKE